MKELLPIKKYFWKYKWLLFLGILFVILTNYFRILAPQITGFVANTVLGSLEIQHPKTANQYLNSINSDSTTAYLLSAFNTKSIKTKVLYAGIILFLLAIISGLFMFLMRQTIIVMSRHIEFDQKNDVYVLLMNFLMGLHIQSITKMNYNLLIYLEHQLFFYGRLQLIVIFD